MRLEEPGGALWDLAYDPEGRLAQVRDPLPADAIAAPATGVPDDDRSRTREGYDADGRVASVRLAVPNAGQAGELPRPGHTYEYPSATETRVRVDGLRSSTDEPNGYNRKVTFDAGGRALTDADATAKTTTVAWDAGDRLVSTTDPANRRSTTIYDGDAPRAQPTGRVSHTYGPAPAACFNAGGTPKGSCSVLPPHTAIDYDTVSAAPARGLAMAGWANAGYSGPPQHRLGPGVRGRLHGRSVRL